MGSLIGWAEDGVPEEENPAEKQHPFPPGLRLALAGDTETQCGRPPDIWGMGERHPVPKWGSEARMDQWALIKA